jgi:hypothetical protein
MPRAPRDNVSVETFADRLQFNFWIIWPLPEANLKKGEKVLRDMTHIDLVSGGASISCHFVL